MHTHTPLLVAQPDLFKVSRLLFSCINACSHSDMEIWHLSSASFEWRSSGVAQNREVELFPPKFHHYLAKIVHSAAVQTLTLNNILRPQLAARLLAFMMGLASWTALTLIVALVWVATRAKTVSTVSWKILITAFVICGGVEVSFQGSCTQVALQVTLWVSHLVQKPKTSSHKELLPCWIIVPLMHHKRTWTQSQG